MARSNSMKKQLSTCTIKSCNEDKIINYKAAWVLQENNIHLLNAQRAMIRELIDILSKSSTDIKEWQNKWHNFVADNEEKLTPYENLWLIFDSAVSSIDYFIEKTDDIIENLKTVRSSIPNEKPHQLLRDKIRQMQSTLNKLSEEINELKIHEVELRYEINERLTRPWGSTLRKNAFRAHQNNPYEELKNISKSIKDKDKSFKNEEKRFYRKVAKIIKQNTTTTLKLNLSMKKQFIAFVKSFDIYPEQFKKALAQCDPKKDLNQWKENILHKNPEQSFEFSAEEEDYDGQKTSQRL
ncbi:unnamed protein product [Rotaria sp. Silwood1]|nr:unnamed protein product [Rotaria sp. Silwood1]CAF1637104.1 unnamed protein product [Rotaria sp. Silwood1]CAF3805165.1 unnamed protein product [Rotaria sp. Silwood1]CAF4921398.1 unnamed protein product [Rotaria sp. Silwood1]